MQVWVGGNSKDTQVPHSNGRRGGQLPPQGQQPIGGAPQWQQQPLAGTVGAMPRSKSQARRAAKQLKKQMAMAGGVMPVQEQQTWQHMPMQQPQMSPEQQQQMQQNFQQQQAWQQQQQQMMQQQNWNGNQCGMAAPTFTPNNQQGAVGGWKGKKGGQAVGFKGTGKGTDVKGEARATWVDRRSRRFQRTQLRPAR